MLMFERESYMVKKAQPAFSSSDARASQREKILADVSRMAHVRCDQQPFNAYVLGFQSYCLAARQQGDKELSELKDTVDLLRDAAAALKAEVDDLQRGPFDDVLRRIDRWIKRSE